LHAAGVARYGASVRDVPYGDLAAVLLDLGNTLIAMDAALVCDALGAEHVACDAGRFRRAEAAARPALSAWMAAGGAPGSTGLVYVQQILARLGLDDRERDAIAPRLLARLRGVPTERLWSSVLPGVPAALEQLRNLGLRLVVVSNSDGTAEAGLVNAGLRGLLDAVVDSAVFGAEKPDPRIFLHALALAGVEPARALHAGDLYAADVVGACAAGIHPLLLDPFGDWPDIGCTTAPDLPALALRIATARV
jgi:putative hydrolase of the HAD superfamily